MTLIFSDVHVHNRDKIYTSTCIRLFCTETKGDQNCRHMELASLPKTKENVSWLRRNNINFLFSFFIHRAQFYWTCSKSFQKSDFTCLWYKNISLYSWTSTGKRTTCWEWCVTCGRFITDTENRTTIRTLFFSQPPNTHCVSNTIQTVQTSTFGC